MDPGRTPQICYEWVISMLYLIVPRFRLRAIKEAEKKKEKIKLIVKK